MQINFEDLQAKTIRSSQGMTVSDNKVDLSKFTGSEFIFTGKYTKGLNLIIRNEQEVTFKDVIIDNATTSPTIRVDGIYDKVHIQGINASLFGKAGNSAAQMIFFNGTWSNVKAGGFKIDQRRDNKTGTTVTGAALQFAGVLKTGHRVGDVHLYGIEVKNAGDEGFYINHFDRGAGYAEGDDLLIEDCKVISSGRDFFQEWGFDKVAIRRCYGEDGMKEGDANHMSAVSINGDTELLLIEDCEFKNIAQLLYSGKPSSGKSIGAIIQRVNYDQGTHAGSRANSSCYLKGPGVYEFKDCTIKCPDVKEAVFSADGSQITYQNCNIISEKSISRTFNGGKITEVPSVIEYKEEITVRETSLNNHITRQYFIGDRELILKP